jgi:hypothetical protein
MRPRVVQEVAQLGRVDVRSEDEIASSHQRGVGLQDLSEDLRSREGVRVEETEQGEEILVTVVDRRGR